MVVELEESAIDFSDIEKKYTLPEPDYFGNIVIVDNLPVVDDVKAPKLLNVLKKIFGGFGRIKEIEMPMGPDNKMSKGLVFLLSNCSGSFDIIFSKVYVPRVGNGGGGDRGR